MTTCTDLALLNAAGRAGGPGACAIYTFSGPNVQVFGLTAADVEVDGVRHRLGKLKISIDGHVKETVNVHKTEMRSDGMLFEVTGLAAGNHVVQLEPVDGWAVVECLKLPTAATVDQTSSGRVVLFDGLVDLSHVSNRSPNWAIDTVNGQFFNNTPARASRTHDTKEFLEYRAGNISRFAIRVYTKSPTQIAARVQVYVDVNGVYGQDPIGLVVSQSFEGGNGGGWTGFDLVPQTRLPDGVDAIAIVFPAGSGASYDPELAAVSLSEAN